MKSALEAADRVHRVLGRIVCKDDCVHVVLDELVKACVGGDIESLLSAFLLNVLEQRLVLIADCDKLSVIMVKEDVDHGMSAITSEHTDFKFCHGI